MPNLIAAALSPEQIHALEARAELAHPDQPVACGREVLALIRELKDVHGHVVAYALAAARVTELATEWSQSRDIQQAAAGRVILAQLRGRQATGLI